MTALVEESEILGEEDALPMEGEGCGDFLLVLGVDQGEEVDPFVQLFGGVSEVGDAFGHVLRGPTGSVLPARKDSGAVVDDEIHEP